MNRASHHKHERSDIFSSSGRKAATERAKKEIDKSDIAHIEFSAAKASKGIRETSKASQNEANKTNVRRNKEN